MPVGAASWSFTEDDYAAIVRALQQFLYESNSRSALLVDRAGQLVATVGEPPHFDPTAFATLTAADFSANDQLARLIGETEFSSLFHQGEQESMYLVDIARPDAESGIESLLRLRLARLGIRLESQVLVAGVGRVDFVLAGRIILEVDGRLNHDGPAQRHRACAR